MPKHRRRNQKREKGLYGGGRGGKKIWSRFNLPAGEITMSPGVLGKIELTTSSRTSLRLLISSALVFVLKIPQLRVGFRVYWEDTHWRRILFKNFRNYIKNLL